MNIPSEQQAANIEEIRVSTADIVKIRKKELIRSFQAVMPNTQRSQQLGYPVVDTLVDVRFYMGRAASASDVYCIVWISGYPTNIDLDGMGLGSAGGHGYDKESASFFSALRDAGIVMKHARSGQGKNAIVEALHAI